MDVCEIIPFPLPPVHIVSKDTNTKYSFVVEQAGAPRLQACFCDSHLCLCLVSFFFFIFFYFYCLLFLVDCVVICVDIVCIYVNCLFSVRFLC
jgi:hypothetical protein